MAAAFALWPCTSWADAPQVHVIALIDVVPAKTAAALSILEARVAAERHGAGVVHVGLLQQNGRPNHFILSETLRDQATYDAQAASAAERQFRTTLFSDLGSPYDELLSTEVTSSASLH